MALDLQTLIAEAVKLNAILHDPKVSVIQKALAVFDFVTTLRNQIPPNHPALVGKLGDGKWLKLILDNLPLLLSLLPLFLDKPKTP